MAALGSAASLHHCGIAREIIEDQRTKRATVPALEQLLYVPIPVLDHGFVRLIDYMGDDSAVVQAARVSYGRGYSACL